MLSGVQYMPSLKMEAIAEGGFSYAEIPYELIERNGLPTYEKKEGESRLLRVSGLTIPYRMWCQISCMRCWRRVKNTREIIWYWRL